MGQAERFKTARLRRSALNVDPLAIVRFVAASQKNADIAASSSSIKLCQNHRYSEDPTAIWCEHCCSDSGWSISMLARVTALFCAVVLFPALAEATEDSLHASSFDPDMSYLIARIPDRNDAIACSGVTNNSARIGPVYLVQSHFLEPEHPFFALNARRPVLVKANITGSGAAPQVKVTARINGTEIGSLCLAGPSNLPAAVDSYVQTRANSFTATLPSAWIRPGLSLSLTTSGQTRNFSEKTLAIGPEPILSLFVQDMLFFGSTIPSERAANWAQRYLTSLPLSGIQVTSLTPIRAAKISIEPRDDGRDRFGNAGRQHATIATRNASCTQAERETGNCTTYGGFAILNAARYIASAFMRANGAERYSQTYALLSISNRVGGGLAGGDVGAGDDLDLTFNHEMGHSADMPHWGSAWYGRVSDTNTRRYPYSGEFGNLPSDPTGGGFGDTWGYDPLDDRIIAPICASTNKERQDPLQRSGADCRGSGQLYDHLSDYSALFTTRYFVGAANAHIGSIPYARDPIGNASGVPFAFPSKNGKVVIEQPNHARPLLSKWDTTLNRYVPQSLPNIDANQLKHWYPQKYNVNVVTFWGAFSTTTPEATMIGEPVRYIGNLRKTWNPSDPADFADIKSWVSGDAFWWGADLVLGVNYADGSHRAAVMKVAPRSTSPFDGDSHEYWAVNFPDDKVITSATLYHRPMEVRNPGTVSAYNINRTGDTTTAANYLDNAPIVATYP
jgi:hypothetical protein